MYQTNNLKSRFFEDLLAGNRSAMEGLQSWLFQPGMLFNSMETWWGERQPRSTPHEGLDLCWFIDGAGQRSRVAQDLRIPATFAGKIVKFDRDFLGISIYLRHEILAADGRQLYTAYGHTQPLASLQVGQRVAEGEIIATIAASPGKKTKVLPHLHLTLAWMPGALATARLAWQNLGHDPAITLLDPLAILAPAAWRLE